ncbi:hypothetical protein ES332_D07G014000v1 [Gossypium tomentosum]|uniref:Uncharacterized protein n=1 Tax=Gossypium tomentosum TaxID=34277 RepID=A0A5D2K1D2_GOSTO|nr:hypothetical protein ES332_D07G014000v1 [Gossypium tomentosum]
MKGGSLFCSKVPRLRTPPPTSPHHHYRRWPTTSDHGGVLTRVEEAWYACGG